ncbi:MAG: hypothetical protein KDC82_02750, partial [Bacteroidetes bacterium]|nr:hypothetical protein [Bacteroidota bacterium]
MFVEEDALNYNLIDMDALHHLVHEHHARTEGYQKNVDWTIKAHCLKLKFVGANLDPSTCLASRKTSTYYNYFLGQNEAQWQSKVPAYQELYFEEIYPKIDLNLANSGNKFKYELVLEPGADLKQVRLNYEGAEKMELVDGNLIISTSVGKMVEQAPYAYQIENGKKIELACQFKVLNEEISFEFPNSYNKNLSLVIDPFIV